MANVLVTILFIQFLLSLVIVQAQLKQLTYNITTGSSISSNTSENSWQSPSGLFSFGFYKRGNGYMIGIWLYAGSFNNTTVVWTADTVPVLSNGKIEFTADGKLILSTTNQSNIQIIPDLQESATSASLLDTGNFVIYDRGLVIWQSFDHPTDTMLSGQVLTPGQKLESAGRFSLIMQADGNFVAYPTNLGMDSADAYWATGTMDYYPASVLLNSTGCLCLRSSHNSSCSKIIAVSNSSDLGDDMIVIHRATLNADGIFRLYSHKFSTTDNSTSMAVEWSALESQCDVRGFCGYNSFCNFTSETQADCVCFPGFAFIDPNNRFMGCYRTFNDEQGCGLSVPTISYNITVLNKTEWGGYVYSSETLSTQEFCAESCLRDCKCWAALYKNMTCAMSKLPLKYGVFDHYSSTIAFIKISFPNISSSGDPIVVVKNKTKLVLVLGLSLGVVAVFCSFIVVFAFLFYRSQASKYQKLFTNIPSLGLNADNNYTLRSFTYVELDKATNGFNDELGRNLDGAAYKGVLSGGQIIIVKGLQRIVEGEKGFRAEITAVGQTHHKNLVRLLGFCIEGDRKFLVYEFLENGSLADLLLKTDRRPNWNERVRIALDVARGIFYLHEECKVCIIHCNIKPQNILFNDSWTAKISDFSFAKRLLPNQSGTFTGVRGTGGYMAPEWHKNQPITDKVDVYSFGVMLLEIICCGRNMEINDSTAAEEVLLTTWVYDCFVANELSRLIGDEEGVDTRTFIRMVKVGLLCIQDDPSLRPAMKSVIFMLDGTMDVPMPPSPTSSIVMV